MDSISKAPGPHVADVAHMEEKTHDGEKDSVISDELHGFVAQQEVLPKGYYRSASFIGTYLAAALGLNAVIGGFGFAAPILTTINADIGPDPNITWVSLSFTLTLSIGMLVVGRLGDLFGYVLCFVPKQ
jgi:hypothetical protein